MRDTDVLSARLATRLAELPEAEVESVGAHRLQTLLARQSADARTAMLTALRDARYLHLLDTLVDLTAAPPFRKAARKAHPADIAADGVEDRPEAVAARGRRHRVAGTVPLRHPTARGADSGQARPLRRRSGRPPAYARPPRASPQPWRTSKPFWGTIRTPFWPKPGCATRSSATPRLSATSQAAHRPGTGATQRSARPMARRMAQGQRQEAPHLGLSRPQWGPRSSSSMRSGGM